MAWVYSTFPREETLKSGSSRTHGEPVFHSVVPERDRKKPEEIIARYTSTRTSPVDDMKKPRYMKNGRYRLLLGTWVEWIAAAMRLEELYAQKWIILSKGERFLITEKDCTVQTRYYNDFQRRRKNSPG